VKSASKHEQGGSDLSAPARPTTCPIVPAVGCAVGLTRLWPDSGGDEPDRVFASARGAEEPLAAERAAPRARPEAHRAGAAGAVRMAVTDTEYDAIYRALSDRFDARYRRVDSGGQLDQHSVSAHLREGFLPERGRCGQVLQDHRLGRGDGAPPKRGRSDGTACGMCLSSQ
jgi:hypothetical protein